MRRHRISAIIPTLNMGRFLPDAIASIERQGVAVDEIIVVDNQSTDETGEVLARLSRTNSRLRVIDVPPAGPARARNKGLEAASGDVIAFLDADDLWPSGKLTLQLARLDRDPQVDLVAGFVTFFDRLDSESLTPAISSRVETVFGMNVGASIYRASIFDSIGRFDETLKYAEDVDLFFRIVERNVPLVILTTTTLYYRRHMGSMISQEDFRKRLPRAFGMSLARRKRNGAVTALPSFETFFEAVPGTSCESR
jgi:glycosyltransferase involved in cell wall biosynthesis